MYAQVNDTRIFFDVDGPGVVFEGTKDVQRPTLLLLPGGPGASHMHYKRPDAGFERLTSRFQTVYVDWRGAGRSDPVDPERITLEGTALDVEALREMLGIEQWVVLGASGGGVWAIAYAGMFPSRVSHLMIVHSIGTCENFADTAESMARRAGITDEKAIEIYRGFTGGELTAPVDEWAASLRATIPTVQNAIYNDPVKHPELVERRTKVWSDTSRDAELWRELDVSRWYLRDFVKNYHVKKYADAITMPTFVTTGENDPVAPPSQSELIHEAIAGSELWVHSGYHMPVGDEVGPFFDRINDFLDRHHAVP